MNLPGVGSAAVDIAVKVDIKFEEASSTVVVRLVAKQGPCVLEHLYSFLN